MRKARTAKDFALRSAYKLGLFELGRNARRNKVAILCYHRFASPLWTDGAIPANFFEAHLEYLKGHFTVIPLKSLSSLATESAPLKNPLVLTVDDGYRDFLEVAVPLLQKYQFPATLFVTTRFVDGDIWLWPDTLRYILLKTEKAALNVSDVGPEIPLRTPSDKKKAYVKLVEMCKELNENDKVDLLDELTNGLEVQVPTLPPEEFRPVSWDALRQLDQNQFEIGSHTLTHPILSRVSTRRATIEIEESKKRIEDALDREVTTFAYPNGTRGDYLREHKELLKRSGYRCAVTCNSGFNENQCDMFELNRIVSPYGIARFVKQVSGFDLLRETVSGNSIAVPQTVQDETG